MCIRDSYSFKDIFVRIRFFIIMAVQKSKKTRSRIGMRRSHDKLKNLTLSTDQVSGEKHLRHQMTKDGFYKGRLVKDLRKPVKEDQEQE